MVGGDSGDIPSADQTIQAAPAVQEALSAPDRQLIKEARHQTLRRVELAHGFFGCPVIRVFADETVGTDESRDAGSC